MYKRQGFLGVDLSSFAVMALGSATIISHDMYPLYKSDASEEEKTKLSRILIFVIAIFSIIISNCQPAPVEMANWIFSFGVPIFVMAILGIWWKRCEMATVITFACSWIVGCIWTTFGLQNHLGLTNFNVNYLVLITSVVLGVVLTAVMPGKKGLFVGQRQKD